MCVSGVPPLAGCALREKGLPPRFPSPPLSELLLSWRRLPPRLPRRPALRSLLSRLGRRPRSRYEFCRRTAGLPDLCEPTLRSLWLTRKLPCSARRFSWNRLRRSAAAACFRSYASSSSLPTSGCCSRRMRRFRALCPRAWPEASESTSSLAWNRRLEPLRSLPFPLRWLRGDLDPPRPLRSGLPWIDGILCMEPAAPALCVVWPVVAGGSGDTEDWATSAWLLALWRFPLPICRRWLFCRANGMWLRDPTAGSTGSDSDSCMSASLLPIETHVSVTTRSASDTPSSGLSEITMLPPSAAAQSKMSCGGCSVSGQASFKVKPSFTAI